jgi:hypothetical protein
MSDLSDLLQGVADTGEMPSAKELKAVINRGLGGSGRSAVEEKQDIVRQLTKYCARIADRVGCLDYETAHEMVGSGVDRFGGYSRGAVGLDPHALADQISRKLQPRQPPPEVKRLDVEPIRKILDKAATTDRPVPDHEIDGLDLAPNISRAAARTQLTEAAGRVRSLTRSGDTVEANRLADKLADRLGDRLLDARAPWPRDSEVPDDDPVKLADLIGRG